MLRSEFGTILVLRGSPGLFQDHNNKSLEG